MKRGMRSFALILCFLFVCAAIGGCAGRELLNEIPKDFALYPETPESAPAESVPAGAGAKNVPGADSAAGADSVPGADSVSGEEEPAECFLMEEAFLFAYEGLSEAEKIWYRDMERILGSFGERELLSAEGIGAGLNEGDIDRIFQSVLCDHPELFYVEGYAYTKYMRGDSLSSVVFSGTYNVELETALERREEIRAAAGAILDGVGDDASDYDKVKYVYDTLIRDTDYDMSAPDNQNIYSVFAHHLSVCQGYAKATQYLLNKLGVECTLVLGTVDTGEGHAWNLVRIDGEYYYVDTTWGDVSYQMEEGISGEEDSHPVMPEINYDYLNVTTEELLRTHTIGAETPMPSCTAVEANYYVREGALFTAYDREQMAELFRKYLEGGHGDVTVKCANAACYGEVLTKLIEEQEIFDYLGEGESTVAYAQNEKQLSLTFWVTNK